jgi:hypothetical protein
VENTIIIECSFCGKEIPQKEGEIISGKKWYHDNCLE